MLVKLYYGRSFNSARPRLAMAGPHFATQLYLYTIVSFN